MPNIEAIFMDQKIDSTSKEEELAQYRVNRLFPLIRGNPEVILYPKTRRDLLRIIKIASKNKIALVPVSSEWDFHGSTVTSGGAIIDLRNLNQIEKIRPTFDGMSIDIEPGVTFEQANKQLQSQGYRLLVPLRQPPQASVVSTHYGKNPVLEANKYGYHQDWMIMTY